MSRLAAGDRFPAVTGSRALLRLFGAAAATWGTLAAATPPAWEIHEAEKFCYAWRTGVDRVGTELGIAVDAARRTTLILANPSWRLEGGKAYALESGFADQSGPVQARGLKIRSNPAVVALIVPVEDRAFFRHIAAASAVHVRTGGPDAVEALLDGATIHSAEPALAEVRRCTKRVEERRLARMRLDHQDRFRSDPPAIWIKGGSRN